MKKAGEKIVMLTCYHSAQSELLNDAGVDIVLVGDSLNMTLLGRKDTLSVTLELMLLFTKTVKIRNKHALLVADMPYKTYGVKIQDSVKNASAFLLEGGADAVKLEAGKVMLPTVKALVKNNIPVMGHLGLLPQSVYQLGGYKVQGRTPGAAEKIKEEALMLQEAGVFSVVLECIPGELAKEITGSLSVPTIGIGAGKNCDGQVLVIDDLLGMDKEAEHKFVKKYLNLGEQISGAVKEYVRDVKEGKFPEDKHTF